MTAFCLPRLPFFEIARVLVRFNHVACVIGTAHNRRVKDWEIIGDRLSKAGWSLGCVSAVDSQGRTIWIVDAIANESVSLCGQIKPDRACGTRIGDSGLR